MRRSGSDVFSPGPRQLQLRLLWDAGRLYLCSDVPRRADLRMRPTIVMNRGRGPFRCCPLASPRTSNLAVLTALLAGLVSASSGHATCDPTTDPDKSDIANARAAVAANCDCAGATSHGAYVSCAAQQANAVLVNKSCAGAVKKCASHSTCGKPAGAVTCYLATTKGTKCKIKKDAAHCTAKQGTVGSCTSCCDACPAPGSGPSCPTTTTSTTLPACTVGQPCGSCGHGMCVTGSPGQPPACIDSSQGCYLEFNCVSDASCPPATHCVPWSTPPPALACCAACP